MISVRNQGFLVKGLQSEKYLEQEKKNVQVQSEPKAWFRKKFPINIIKICDSIILEKKIEVGVFLIMI